MQIKLQALLNGATEVRERFGDGGLERVLSACSPAVRDRCETGIAIEWHPRREFDEFLDVSERLLGRGDGGLARAIGARGAYLNTRGWVTRALLFVLNPKWVLEKAASTFHQFNDTGELTLPEFRDGHCRMELRGIPDPNALFCETFSGWAEVMGERIGFGRVRVEHTKCRARGDRTCSWDVDWQPKDV
ncbi:MAG: hypothetical protein H6718_13875 [Polyangiaceae bacterium]|nr:hypothetical protein [Polyangiaceae bacterium]MCB9605993.1 hypothetical protein [Polyangiaceae bacterium]